MTISNALCLLAVFSVGFYAAADDIPSAAAEAHYSLRLEDEPEGVYEWPERDLIFVQVRIPAARNASPEKIESAELSATRRVLHSWLTKKAAKRRVDPILPFGLDFARTLCRQHFPLLEYTANWNFSGDSCCFSREKGKEHVAATVFRASDVLASIPNAYLKPVPTTTWIDGLTRIVKKSYLAEGDLAFMWRIGALDCLDVARTTKAKFPSIMDKAFGELLRKYIEDANDTWNGVSSPANDEYTQIRKELADYLSTSVVAKGFHDVAVSLELPSVRVMMSEGAPFLSATTNIVVSVVTNDAVVANPITNVSIVAQSETDGAVLVMPRGNKVVVNSVRTDEKVISEIVTKTIVCTTKTMLRKTESTYSGEPRFECLFLSGGSLPNKESSRINSGVLAERIFYGRATMADRERAILNALRENPGDKVLWNLYGRLFQNRRDWYGAIICFRNALRIDKEYDFALTNLADVYREMGKKNLAVGLALLARGFSTNDWCIKHLEAILFAKW